MARPLIPFVQNGYYASRNWIPLVKGNGFTTSGGGEQEKVWETASGSIVTFDAVAAPLRQLSVSVEPVQNLNGYDNPWPAGGGKNLLQLNDATNKVIGSTGFSVTIANGEITLSGISTNGGGRTTRLSPYFMLKAGTYILSPALNTGAYVRGYLNKRADNTEVGNYSGHSFTISEDVEVYYGIGIASGYDYSGIKVKPQLETGSTITTYAPYSNICPITGWDSVNIWVQPTHDTSATPTATIQLGETVYGGTLDVVNGKMTVDRAMVDLGTLAWQYNTTWAPAPRFYTTTLRDKVIHYPGGQYPDGTLCSSYIVSKNTTVSTVGNDKTIGIGGDGYIYIQDESYDGTTLNDFKAALSGVQFVYMLATPFELTLTPEQISTIQGTNNVWSDAGDVTVEYRAQ